MKGTVAFSLGLGPQPKSLQGPPTPWNLVNVSVETFSWWEGASFPLASERMWGTKTRQKPCSKPWLQTTRETFLIIAFQKSSRVGWERGIRAMSSLYARNLLVGWWRREKGLWALNQAGEQKYQYVSNRGWWSGMMEQDERICKCNLPDPVCPPRLAPCFTDESGNRDTNRWRAGRRLNHCLNFHSNYFSPQPNRAYCDWLKHSPWWWDPPSIISSPAV